jgi:hypothetical protein
MTKFRAPREDINPIPPKETQKTYTMRKMISAFFGNDDPNFVNAGLFLQDNRGADISS